MTTMTTKTTKAEQEINRAKNENVVSTRLPIKTTINLIKAAARANVSRSMLLRKIIIDALDPPKR